MDRLSASGPLAVIVPAGYGGADVSRESLAEIFRLLAAADASLAQVPRSHFVHAEVTGRRGTRGQREFFHAELFAGRRPGNARSEAGTRHVQDIRTLGARPDGSYV